MITIHEVFQASRDKLEAELAKSIDLTAAVDGALAFMDRLLNTYMDKQQNVVARYEMQKLFPLASASLASLYSASKVRIQITPASTYHAESTSDVKRLLKYSPILLSLLLSAALLALGNIWLIVLGVASAASCLWYMLKEAGKSEASPAIQGFVQVNTTELSNRIDQLCLLLDQYVANALLEHTETDDLVWTQLQFQAFQTLWEAKQSQDGQYALKSISPLIEELERQGVDIMTYHPDNSQYFDCLPGIPSGETIRPAMRKGSRLIARGQATTGM